MTLDLAYLILMVLAVGMLCQWLSWRMRMPAIVLLIAAGFVLGPFTGLLDIKLEQNALTHVIGLGVAIILFEGGMALNLNELKRSGRGIRRLVVLGAPIAWGLGSAAAYFIGGLSWPVSCVLGAILVVTGPTVVQPILEHARLNRRSSSLLRWEGILNDPIGVLLAVLVYQYFTIAGEGLGATLTALSLAVLVALLTGGLGGWLVGKAYRKGFVPEYLKPPILMVLVLIVFSASNLVQKEAGLLSVTLMGMVLGNMQLGERDELQHFKENLTVILISVLFIVITSELELEQLAMIDFRIVLLVLAFLLLVRPLSILLATLGSTIERKDRILLAWIAPRGIVAAATVGLFGPGLVDAGYSDAALLIPIVFAVIIVTVLLHSLTLAPLARKMDLAADDDNGLLIVGASNWSVALADALNKLGIETMLVDGVYQKLKPARMNGLETYYGEILSEDAETELETHHLSHLLCATDNDFYNALVCAAKGPHFGQHRTLQLPSHQEFRQSRQQLSRHQRGDVAFEDSANFEQLHERLSQGWSFQHSLLTDEFTLENLLDNIGSNSNEAILIAAIDADGKLQMKSEQQPLKPAREWRVIYFASNENASSDTGNHSTQADDSD